MLKAKTDVLDISREFNNDPPCSLPVNIVVWNPSNGSVVTINNPNPLYYNEISVEKAAVIYPNPANKKVSIDFFDKNNTVKVEVYNAYGCSIKSISVNTGKTFNLDISAFSTGIYYFYISMNKFRECFKILVVR